MLKIKNVVKSNESKQVNNGMLTSVNTGRYVNIGVTTHAQYNNDVSMSKAQYLFDTVNNVDLFNAIDETLVKSTFETIGEEVVICGCITMQDIIDIYANGCIQQFYECFCKSHSASESITLARFLSAIGIEVWRNVVCYNGIYKGEYLVSNLGRVLRLYKTRQAKIIKPCDNGLGYLSITLCHKGIKQNVTVHRLVGLTFYGVPTEKLECCHSNTNSHDNRLFNLDFKTHLENVNNPITQRKLKETWVTKAKTKSTASTATSASTSTLE